MKFEKDKEFPRIKFEVRKGKKRNFNLYIFPGHKTGDMIFPGFCVLLNVTNRFKGGVIQERAFTMVLN